MKNLKNTYSVSLAPSVAPYKTEVKYETSQSSAQMCPMPDRQSSAVPLLKEPPEIEPHEGDRAKESWHRHKAEN